MQKKHNDYMSAKNMTFMQMLRLAVAPKTIYQSDDGHIVILDRIEHKRPVRLLLYDGVRESGVYLDENGDTDPLFYYMQSLKEISLFYEGLDKALLIGGGGMAFPRYYTSCVPGGRMTVVEKDSGMLDLARKYFSFAENDRVRAVVGDGIKHISQLALEIAADEIGSESKKYDFIVFDAFEGRKPVKELLSEGVLKLTYQITRADGILAINMLNGSEGVISMQTHLCQAILKKIYKNTKIINCPQGWNCILMASDREL